MIGPALVIGAAWYWLSSLNRNPTGAGYRDKSGKFHPIRNSEWYQPSLLDEPETTRPAQTADKLAKTADKPAKTADKPAPPPVVDSQSGPEPSGLYWPFATFDRARQEWRLVFPKAKLLQTHIDLLNAIETVEKFQSQVDEGQAALTPDQWRGYSHLGRLFRRMNDFIYARDKALQILRAIDIETEGDSKGMGARAMQNIYDQTQQMSQVAEVIGAAVTIPIRDNITNEKQERESWRVWADNQATLMRTKKIVVDDMIKERAQKQYLEAGRLREEQQRAELAAIQAAHEARKHAQRALLAELDLDDRLAEIVDALHPSLDADAKKLSASLLAADAVGDEAAAYNLRNGAAQKLLKRSLAAWKKDGITDPSRTGQAELAKAVSNLQVGAQVSLSGAEFLNAVNHGAINGLQGLHFYASVRVFTTNNKINVESTDGVALSRGSSIAAITHPLDVLVPGKQLVAVARSMGRAPVLGLSVAKVGTKDSLILSTRIDGRREVIPADDYVFPSQALETVIKQSTDWRSSVDSDALDKAMKKWAPIFKREGRSTAAIALTPANTGVTVAPLETVVLKPPVYGRYGGVQEAAVKALMPVSGAEEFFPAATKGSGTTMTLNVARVLEAIKGLRGKLAISARKDAEDAVKIESPDGNSVAVIMPMFGGKRSG